MEKEQQEKKLSPIDYFLTAQNGTVIAFRLEVNGRKRTLSGMIVGSAETSDGVVTKLVQTKNGSKFTVGSEDVVWVKTGSRWPSWVFEQFKEKAK